MAAERVDALVIFGATGDLAKLETQQIILQAMRAVLSDDHNYERGLTTLTELIDRIAKEAGGTTL
jgi:glucose-6-phosphate 1-dehydrogenase